MIIIIIKIIIIIIIIIIIAMNPINAKFIHLNIDLHSKQIV